MAIASTDLIYYGSANNPESDSGTAGGAIDTSIYIVPSSSSLFNALNDTVEVLSSASGDTSQTVTVTGRTSSGSITSDVISLNGTNVVAGVVTFERIMKIVISASHTGTITIRKTTGDTTIASLPSGVLSIRRLFYGLVAEASGGSTKDAYEKIFVKNTHATLSLLSAQVQENADLAGLGTFDLEDAVNDNNSVANRLTAPTGMLSSFSGTAKNVPGTDLAAGSAIGIWIKISLPAGTSPAVSTYTPRLTGSST